jgi:cytochrome c551/c552
MKKIPLKKIALGFVIILVICQFFRIDKVNPPVDPAQDLFNLAKAPEDVTAIVKKACYDCHSNEVKYPWYTNIAPVSWWIKDHVNEGSRHLNFSIWGTYKTRRQDKKLKECVENIEEGEMPMYSYVWMHGEAKLSQEEKEKLMSWFNSQRTHESDKPKEGNEKGGERKEEGRER